MTLLQRFKYAWKHRHDCLWCDGTGIFHPHLPLACPVCKGTGRLRGK